MKKIIWFITIMFAMSSAAALEPQMVEADKLYEPAVTINLRETPPQGFLKRLGDRKGEVQPGDKLVVQDIEEVNGFLGRYYWFKVGTSSDADKSLGWIYGGEKEKTGLLERVK